VYRRAKGTRSARSNKRCQNYHGTLRRNRRGFSQPRMPQKNSRQFVNYQDGISGTAFCFVPKERGCDTRFTLEGFEETCIEASAVNLTHQAILPADDKKKKKTHQSRDASLLDTPIRNGVESPAIVTRDNLDSGGGYPGNSRHRLRQKSFPTIVFTTSRF